MSDIGPGDWVEYVGPEGGWATTGSVYCVEALEANCAPCLECGNGGPAIILRGLPCRELEMGFCVCEVRPIYRQDESLIERLKARAPSELEDA